MSFRTRIVSPHIAIGLVFALGVTGFSSALRAQPTAAATDAEVTRLTTNILEQSQLAHRSFDDALAGTLLERYTDALDGSHSLFLQSDIEEFAKLGPTLARAMRKSGETAPSETIFARYKQRLAQREEYVDHALHTAPFDFTGHDRESFDRENAPYPNDLAAAQALWLQRLRAEYLQEKLDGKTPEQTVRGLRQRYAQQVQTMKGLTHDEILETWLDALAHVYDPHSDYLGHEQMESFSSAMSLSLVGIGASLETNDGYCKIHALIPGGPAARGGILKPGDRIVAVAEQGKPAVDITAMPLSRAVTLIRGTKGTSVVLTVIPAGAPEGSPPRKETVVRDAVKLEDQEARAQIIDLPTERGGKVRLGMIDLPSFYADMGSHTGSGSRSATADVARLLAKLRSEGVRGIVLDLRRNGGGSLEEAISLTGLFIGTGPVVQTRDQTGNVDIKSDTDPAVAYDGPLILLTSRFSASASEILAGALQDYRRALVVGDSSTFGKGTVQNVLPLAPLMNRFGLPHAYDPGALKITIEKFYRPGGASTQLRGVAADIVLPSASDLGEVSESALKDPLPWDAVRPAPFVALGRVRPYVDVLRVRSARRVANEREFRDLADEIAARKTTMATKSISLNESERRQELARFHAHERVREERAHRSTSPVVYPITLANASSPGLPAMLVPPKRATKPSANPLATTSAGASTASDTLWAESLNILADYVDLQPASNEKGDEAVGARSTTMP